MCLRPRKIPRPQTHIKGVLETKNTPKSLLELGNELRAYLNGLGTPKTHHLRGKHEFTAQEHAWTVNPFSSAVNTILSVKMPLKHLLRLGIKSRSNHKCVRDLNHQ